VTVVYPPDGLPICPYNMHYVEIRLNTHKNTKKTAFSLHLCTCSTSQ